MGLSCILDSFNFKLHTTKPKYSCYVCIYGVNYVRFKITPGVTDRMISRGILDGNNPME